MIVRDIVGWDSVPTASDCNPSATGLQAKLASLALTGLPVPDLNRQAPRWETCPYVPQNGYGRFSADYLSNAGIVEKLAAGVSHV